jgi:hypothetical protein
MINSSRMRWASHVAGMEKRTAYDYWWESQKERDY